MPVSIEVTVPGSDQKTYLPLGAELVAIDAESGDPLKDRCSLECGKLVLAKALPYAKARDALISELDAALEEATGSSFGPARWLSISFHIDAMMRGLGMPIPAVPGEMP